MGSSPAFNAVHSQQERTEASLSKRRQFQLDYRSPNALPFPYSVPVCPPNMNNSHEAALPQANSRSLCFFRSRLLDAFQQPRPKSNGCGGN